MDIKTEQKWIKKWHDSRIFEPEIDSREKFFVNFPYPYVNGYLHIGHFYTLMRVEALARYKRAQGFNVLFPQAWHCTGSPIASAAQRIKERESKQWEIMRGMDFSDKEIEKFKNPEHWITFFPKEAKKDLTAMGFSIDFRREFITTELNPRYDKFIRWQFRKLKEKGCVIKGKFPVVWDPKNNVPVGDHDRVEGEGETPKDFIWIKFRLRDSDLILMAGTTRPDALYGQVNLWLDPKATYKIVLVDGEKWVIGEKAILKIEEQYKKPEIIGKITAKELIGKWVQGPIANYPIYILPADFIDSNVGSGIVYSALEDPVDLYELYKIQHDKNLQKEFELDDKVVAKLKPISIIEVPEMGNNLGEEIGKEFGIISANEKKKLEDAKNELNKRVFRKGIMKNNCSECSGLTIPAAQEFLKKKLVKDKDAVMFYELTGKVVSRSLTECIVKIVDNQWFINYADKDWKKKTHKALDNLRLYPEKSRQQFDYVIDWLHEWACTREFGLGTKLPWDEKWVIESLSDSTIYLAYYTIAHIIKDIPEDEINDKVFDYIFYGEGRSEDKRWDDMRREFNYWYPVDFRNSGKDLIQNHLAFFLFNHTAIFPEKHWPKGIGVNGWVLVDGDKMSKSKGNFILLREMPEKFGSDSSRLTILSGGEELDDPNWDSELAKSLKTRLESFRDFCANNYNKGIKEKRHIDLWMLSQLNKIIKETTEAMEQTLFRTASQKCFFELNNLVKWYMKRSVIPNVNVLKKVIESQIIMLSVYCPFICEEAWHDIGKKTLISQEKWPELQSEKIDEELNRSEIFIENVINDINQVKKLAKIDNPKKIILFVADPWKYYFVKRTIEEFKKTKNVGEIIKNLMSDDKLRTHGIVVNKLIPKIAGKVNENPLKHALELKILQESSEFLSKEFNCEIEIAEESKSKEPKASQAMPGKPAIVVE